MRAPSLFASFRFAFSGIVYAFRTQRNLKVHLGITAAVVIVGLWLRLPMERWAALAVTIGLVFQAELFNTALEAIVDHVSPDFSPLARVAKDCAAGAVFLSAACAVVVGLLILGPPLLEVLAAIFIGANINIEHPRLPRV
jgi:diacylglycerol kinase